MYNLLRERQNNFFDDYKIIVCAGAKAGIGVESLYPVLNAEIQTIINRSEKVKKLKKRKGRRSNDSREKRTR